jgi:hypothetical protein
MLENPLDIMPLLHKAFMTQSIRNERLLASSFTGGDLVLFQKNFELSERLLTYHISAEDLYMTSQILDSPGARVNEDEHVELRDKASDLTEFLSEANSTTLTNYVQETILASDHTNHDDITETTEAILNILSQTIGQPRIAKRKMRDLYERVVALRFLESDHFENEESFIATQIIPNMPRNQQLEIVKHLLLDQSCLNSRWIIEWLMTRFDSDDQKVLSNLILLL